MKQLACEMCGSNDLVKQDGFFVCQYCGAKYSVEEARKLLNSNDAETPVVVKVDGAVQVDNSKELENLYRAARNARESGDDEAALKHYERISVMDPDSWEAYFYMLIIKVSKRKDDVNSLAYTVNESINRVFKLIRENVAEENKKKEAVGNVVKEYIRISNGILYLLDWDINHTKVGESRFRAIARIAGILQNCGDAIESSFNMEIDEYKKYAAMAWKEMIRIRNKYGVIKSAETYLPKAVTRKYADKVKKFEPEYKMVEPEQTGCYVATAVYGSYDCPEVWTLRRYRDYTLAATWQGRVFIKIYYAISPTLVKWFGHTDWFKKMWRGKLDRMVVELQARGVEATPYEDRHW